jgi:hypothetical protein
MRSIIAAFVRLGGLTLSFTFVLALAGGCSNPDKAQERLGIKPAYDPTTGKLKQLAYDSNHNGTPDTWTDMNGTRPVETRIDRNEDGRLDRWEYYDEKSTLVKVGFSRTDNGKADAWAFSGADGKIQRIEISSVGDDKKIDRWEHYDARGMTAAEEDTNHDGAPDKWETYEAGIVKTAAFDENGDGRPDRRLTYSGGSLVTIESEPDAAGNFTKRLDVQPSSGPSSRLPAKLPAPLRREQKRGNIASGT